ncbi:hypothetical protein RDI58_014664 [Solanum bulbocastanum]|uniref:Uncharacterized protein n=1 Tax=Solanum bulbocastanum TaxID=147425 RepID=A0AAN8TGD3_SOLBU
MSYFGDRPIIDETRVFIILSYKSVLVQRRFLRHLKNYSGRHFHKHKEGS